MRPLNRPAQEAVQCADEEQTTDLTAPMRGR